MIGHYNNKINRITFCLDNYANREDMFQDVAKVIAALVRNGEICTFFCEEGGVFVLQHNYDDVEFGCEVPKWVTQDDWEDFQFWKESLTDDGLTTMQPEDIPFTDVESNYNGDPHEKE